MAIQHYKGELGEFEYNDEIFSVKQIKDIDNSTYEILSYIGSETDGSKIEIPQGITDCFFMFAECSLTIPPVIPDGVVDCTSMFLWNNMLESPPVIPDGVRVCDHMFAGCISLEDYETQHKLDNENYDGQHRLMVCADFDEDDSEERNE